MSDYLFVYGTLQPGLAPAKVADLAAKLQPVGKGYVRGMLYDLGGYPGAMPDPLANSIIAGTVMELPEDASVLRRLDNYEGFDPRAPETSEYIRVRQTVELDSGRTLECWFYRYNRPQHRPTLVEGGAWQRGFRSRSTR